MSVLELERAMEAVSSDSRPALVLDLEHLPEEPDEDVWTFGGQRWNAGQRWQDAYYRLSVMEADEVAETLRTMDDLVRDASPQDALSPDWPLALAVLRRAGVDHPDADEIRADWRKLAPFDGLSDPVMIELLAVPPAATIDEGTPAVEEPRAEWDDPDPADVELPRTPLAVDLASSRLEHAEVPDVAPESERLADLLDRVHDRSDHWRELLDDVVAARPHLTWPELVDAWEHVHRVEEGLVVKADVPVDVRQALLLWLRAAPLLALRETVNDLDRKLAGAGILLGLGVGIPEVARAGEGARVAALLATHPDLPVTLVELLHEWQRTYERCVVPVDEEE